VSHLDALGDLSYSRRQENQADAFALACLQQAYGHVGGAGAFFEMIEYKGLRVQLLDTHPLPRARIDRIEELIREAGLTVEPVTRLPTE
jgi:predicted Zn-dependent protease